jgi:hypothetical protein
MYCPNCKQHVDPVVAEYSFWLRPGGGMMYNVRCTAQKHGEEYIATTDFFGQNSPEARLVGCGATPEAAAKDLRRLLGHKEEDQAG